MDSGADGVMGTRDDSEPVICPDAYAELVEMVGGAEMPEVLADLLETYVEEAATLVGRLVAAHAAGDPEEMLRPAHSLKSSSGSVGALRLSRLCADLEQHLRGQGGELDVDRQVVLLEEEYRRVHDVLTAERARLLGG